MISEHFREHLEIRLGDKYESEVRIIKIHSVGGGCINETYRVDTTNRPVFIKFNSASRFPGMFEAESHGLDLLTASSSLKIPEVLLIGTISNQAYLVLEFIESGEKSENFWQSFGRGLAELHLQTAPNFGLGLDNFIGSLPQPNSWTKSFSAFFKVQRLGFQIKLARDNGKIDKSEADLFKPFFDHLTNLFPDEKPCLLHGDLWSGNFMVGQSGEPVLIDPAVYYGHREAELAFTKLFGGFSPQFYHSYDQSYPLEPGFEQRVDFYNLYPLMVHVNLFGRSYWSSVKSILKKL